MADASFERYDEPEEVSAQSIRPGDWLDLAEIIRDHPDACRPSCVEGDRCDGHLEVDFEFSIVESWETSGRPEDPTLTFHFENSTSVEVPLDAVLHVWGRWGRTHYDD